MQPCEKEIECLQGRSNYSDWAFSMKMVLINRGLWGTIEPRQDEVVTRKMKLLALSTICLNVEKCNYSHVRDAVDALDAWNKLKNAFDDSGLTRRIGLLRQLTKVSLTDCGSVEEYVDKLVSTSQALNNAGFEVDDEWLAALLLKGLPDKYEPMVMALEASGVKITTEMVKAKILQAVSSESQLTVFHAKTAKKEQFQSQLKGGCEKPAYALGAFTQVKCWKCRKFGHICRECPLKSKKRKGNHANSNICALSVASKAEYADPDGWYFDSGATSHMTRHREWFGENYEDENHTVVAANGQHLKVVGSGDVKVVDQNNERDCVSAKQVKFVPSLNTNFLSVSKIVQNGHRVVFHRKGCRVISAAGDVLATGRFKNGLFILNQRKKLNNQWTSHRKRVSTRGRKSCSTH